MRRVDPHASHKACSKCGCLKPLSSFNKESKASDEKRAECKECQQAEQRTGNRGLTAKAKKYGMTKDELLHALFLTNGECPICLEHFDPYKLVIDHDHVTGLNRGAICQSCNKMLGFARKRLRVNGVNIEIGDVPEPQLRGAKWLLQGGNLGQIIPAPGSNVPINAINTMLRIDKEITPWLGRYTQEELATFVKTTQELNAKVAAREEAERQKAIKEAEAMGSGQLIVDSYHGEDDNAYEIINANLALQEASDVGYQKRLF